MKTARLAAPRGMGAALAVGRRRQARAALAVALCVVAPLAGCDRKPRFVERTADTAAVAAPDSTATQARAAADLWDRAQDRKSVAQASEASSRLARGYLAARGGDSPAEGLTAYLDSLGLGAEVAADAGDSGLVAVNFFSRTNPEAGSEPYLFWREKSGVRAQPVEGRSLRLYQAATRDLAGREAALLFGRPAPGGYEPLLLAFRLQPKGNRFELAQTVGADSMGGVGRAEFGWQDTMRLVKARTYRQSPRFEECASCPHVYRKRVLAWGPEGFHVIADEVEASPYQSFVQFVNLLEMGDERGAAAWATEGGVVRDARKLGWDRPSPGWRLAPGGEESRDQMVFFRGPQQAYRVSFELRDRSWKVARIEPTERTIE